MGVRSAVCLLARSDVSAMSRLPRGVVAKLRTKVVIAAKRRPGPQVDEWDDKGFLCDDDWPVGWIETVAERNGETGDTTPEVLREEWK